MLGLKLLKNSPTVFCLAIQDCKPPVSFLSGNKLNFKLNATIACNHTFSNSSNNPHAKLFREASTQAKHQASLNPSQPYESFKSSDLKIVRCTPNELNSKPNSNNIAFGHCFTDHMFRCDWDNEEGWSVPSITKINNLELHPASKVLHYALETFEGAKAFRGIDNKIRFFRLDQNVNRLIRSAARLSLPRFDEQELIDCIHKLVQLDQDWVPESKETQLSSLYIRPTIIGCESSLGVAASRKAILYVLLSPVGSYFKTGFKPVNLYADPKYVRAWPGGAGDYKLGANYAPTIMIQKEAERRGFQQVLWLFDDDLKLTEVGTMNIFVSYNDAKTGRLCVVTPPIRDGLILPGITRKSIIELLNQWSDVEFEERYITLGEIEALSKENRLVEMFGSGTAGIVCPISSINLKDGITINIPYFNISLDQVDEASCVSQRLLKAITDIQYGRIQHSWAQELLYQ